MTDVDLMTEEGEPVSEGELALLAAEAYNIALEERLADLEMGLGDRAGLMAEDRGWIRLGEDGDLDLSPTTLAAIIRRSQTMYLRNPLIDHAVGIISYYVFGQGVQISGRGVCNDRVQALLDDVGNRRVLLGPRAMIEADAQVTYEGNLFLVLVSPPDGSLTRIRDIPTLEIVERGDIIRNPEDKSEPWYYRRVWTSISGDGTNARTHRVDYYPDVHYNPARKPKRLGEGELEGVVHWDQPVLHVKDGGLRGGKYGVPITYSSLDWARAVSADLSNYATIRRSLARFAWKGTAKDRQAARTMQAALNRGSTIEGESRIPRNPAPVTGAAAVMTEGNDLTPMKTAGMVPSPEEGKRLWNMVAAGTGIPETILAGNADAGNLATAETLDRPTELQMRSRQTLWLDVLTTVIVHDLKRAIAASLIPTEDEVDPATSVAAPTDTTPDIAFPPILERDRKKLVDAIVSAATLDGRSQAGTMPDEVLSRLLLTALDVDDIDAILEEMFPPEGLEIEDDEGEDPDAGLVDPLAQPVADPLVAPLAPAIEAIRGSIIRQRGAVRSPGRSRSSRARRGSEQRTAVEAGEG